MAVAVTSPVDRGDDVRALKFRIREITFSGNYATGGETLNASDFNLKFIAHISTINAITGVNAGGVAGTVPTFVIASNGRSVVVRQLEDAAGAAGTTFGQEKTNAEAYVAGSVHRVLVIGW